MSGRQPRFILMPLGFFLAPILLVKAIGFTPDFGATPQSAAAQPAVLPHIPTGAPATASEEERAKRDAAWSRALEMRSINAVLSPFAHDEPGLPATETETLDTPKLEPPPHVSVQAIVGGSEPTAMIDGKLYRAGQILDRAGTWRVDRIDVLARRVILREDASDREVVLVVLDALVPTRDAGDPPG